MTTLALDIGGTFIRRAIYCPAGRELRQVSEFAAPWCGASHVSPTDFMRHVEAIVAASIEAAGDPGPRRVAGISIAACMNHHTGVVLGSAPILGPARVALDFAAHLSSSFPGWTIACVNDVTALCFGHIASGTAEGMREIAALTVSSGIAMRRVALSTSSAIVDPVWGIQGEVGHLPCFPSGLPGPAGHLCDCGGTNHIASVASGKGLDRLFGQLQELDPSFRDSRLAQLYRERGAAVPALRERLERNDRRAAQILDGVAAQLGHLLLYVFAICPELSCVFVSGGLVDGLDSHLAEAIMQHVRSSAYVYDGAFFADRIRFARVSRTLGLLGAAYYADTSAGRA